jgi:hypothetical protein
MQTKHIWRGAVALLPLLLGIVYSGAAAARTTKGPQVSVESAQPAEAQDDDDEAGRGFEIARRRTDVNVLVPIPFDMLWGLWVLKVDHFDEKRQYSDDAPDVPDHIKNPKVTGTGFVYLPHAKEGAPRFFAVAERYARMDDDGGRPMAEFVLGADVADEDMPFNIRPAPTDESEVRLLVRHRQFPGYNRWLLLGGYQLERKSGLTFEATIPSQVMLGWQTPEKHWKVYTGIRWQSREYPYTLTDGTQGWMDGHTQSVMLALRRRIYGPLFVTVEGGRQQELLHYMDENGETLDRQRTASSPWVRVALETWIDPLAPPQ